MPEITTLSAERRARAGKGAARATRRMGRVPGIIYGGDRDPMLISLEPRELSRALAKRGFLATLVELLGPDAAASCWECIAFISLPAALVFYLLQRGFNSRCFGCRQAGGACRIGYLGYRCLTHGIPIREGSNQVRKALA